MFAQFLQDFAEMTGAAKCRPYVLPDHYTIPLVPGDFNQIEKPRGMLFVSIISAANVPKMDWFNGSDPYVRYACLLLADLYSCCLQACIPDAGCCCCSVAKAIVVAALWLKVLL